MVVETYFVTFIVLALKHVQNKSLPITSIAKSCGRDPCPTLTTNGFVSLSKDRLICPRPSIY